MSETRKIILSIVVVILALATVWFFVHNSSPKNQFKHGVILEKAKNLIIKDKDCEKALLMIADILDKDSINAEAWSWKGVCEFQMQNFPTAKISFEKALSLDSSLVAPKNYLKIINKANSISIPVISVTREEFESKLGLKLDSTQMKFLRVTANYTAPVVPIPNMPADRKIPESMIAEYKSLKSFDETVKYVTSVAKNMAQMTVTVSSAGQDKIIKASSRDGKYFVAFFVKNNTSMGVFVSYMKTQ